MLFTVSESEEKKSCSTRTKYIVLILHPEVISHERYLFLQFCLRSLYIGLKWASLTFAKGKYSCAPIRIQQHLTQDQRTVLGSLLMLSMNSD